MAQETCIRCQKSIVGELITYRTYSNGMLAYKVFGYKCPHCNIYVDQGCMRSYFTMKTSGTEKVLACPQCGLELTDLLVFVERRKDSAFYLEQRAAPVFANTFLDEAHGETKLGQLSKIGLVITNQRLIFTSAKLYYDSLEKQSKTVQGAVKVANFALENLSFGGLTGSPLAPSFQASSVEYEDIEDFEVTKTKLGEPQFVIRLKNGLEPTMCQDGHRDGDWEVFEQAVVKAREAAARSAPLVSFPEGEKVIYRNSYIRLMYYLENNSLPGFGQLVAVGSPNRMVITDRRVFLYFLVTAENDTPERIDLQGNPTPYSLTSLSIPFEDILKARQARNRLELVLRKPVSWWTLPGTVAFPVELLSYQIEENRCQGCGEKVLGSPVVAVLPAYSGARCRACGKITCKSCLEKDKSWKAKLRGPVCASCQNNTFTRIDPSLPRPSINGKSLGMPQYVHTLGESQKEWTFTLCEEEWGPEVFSALQAVCPELVIERS